MSVGIFTDIDMFAASRKPMAAKLIGTQMKIITVVLAVSLLSGSMAVAATYVSDGSAADTQAKISSAVDGDIVQLPAGTFTWTTAVSIAGKGVKLQGAGSGRIVGRSTTSTTIGTGTKTFTTQSGLSLTAGQAVVVERTGGAANGNLDTYNWPRASMTGTVVSYSGTTLTVNVTSTAGSGTHGLWVITTAALTTVVYSSSGTMLTLNEDATHHVELSGVRFIVGSPSGTEKHMVDIHGSGGKPVLVHDCYFENNGNVCNIYFSVNRGVIWNCSFPCFPFSMAAVALKMANHSQTTDWSTKSTMGTNDVNGAGNIYFEDCDFHGYLNCLDWDSNARAAMRYCIFNNAGTTTHGNDSSYYGVRHYQYYNNKFIFNDLGNATLPLNWWFFLRGGTGVFADNEMDNINSSWWGDKAEFQLAVLNLREAWGPYACWGAGIAGVQYPAPRQIGQGYVTGAGVTDPTWGYRGDSEPMYIWNNVGSYSVSMANGGGSCTDADSSSDYIQSGRDYIINVPKPGFVKYTYPHPLRAMATGATPTAPQVVASPASVSVVSNQPVTFSVTASGSNPLTYQWQKNSANIAGAASASYSIASVLPADAASYRCLVTNSVGAATSAVAVLTVTLPVLTPPTISAGPASLTVSAGQPASFSVTASGTDPLTYQWQKNAANIAGATAAAYSIASTTTNDGGGFRCIVANLYGAVTSSVATLSVSATAPTGNLRYVDFTAGSDSNPGTSTSPWKRCPGMVGWAGTATLSPGDTVYFDRSDTWSIAANAAGAGLELKAGVHYIGNVWNPSSGAGTRAILFAAGVPESGVVRIWEDHATYATWIEGFEINGNNQRANLVDINHAHWKTGLTKGMKRVENCVVHNNSGDGSLGYYTYGIIISDNSPDASGWVANVEILNTVLYTVSRDGICLYPAANGMISNVVVRGCEVYDTGHDPSYSEGHGILIKGDVRNSVVEFNYSHDVNSSAVFINGPETGSGPGPSGCTVRYNVLQTADNNGVIRFYGTGSKSVDVYGNLVLPNELTGGLSFAGNSGTISARIYNNTFYNSFVDIGSPSSTGTIEFRNNIIYELDDVPLNDPGSKITSHANNVLFRSGGGTLVTRGGTSYNSSTLGTYESTALSSDPVFKNTANLPNQFAGVYGSTLAPINDGLSVQLTSPQLNGAAALGSPFNGSINSVARPTTGGWDFGAYQHAGGSTPPAPAQVSGVAVSIIGQ